MLIINESSVCAFLLTVICLIYLVITFTYHLFYCTCWVPTIRVLNLATFPCYSNLLLKRRRWTGIIWCVVLGYVLPRLLFLWCYEVFCYFISLRVILVFRDIIYVIIIVYSWHLVICGLFWPYVWNNWSWVMHTMSIRFWHKNWVRQRAPPISSSVWTTASRPHARCQTAATIATLTVATASCTYKCACGWEPLSLFTSSASTAPWPCFSLSRPLLCLSTRLAVVAALGSRRRTTSAMSFTSAPSSPSGSDWPPRNHPEHQRRPLHPPPGPSSVPARWDLRPS
jgi:hypothetical protein